MSIAPQQAHAMASAINAYQNASKNSPINNQFARGILGLGIGSIPIVGSLASTLLNYGLDSLKIHQQNRYNSPQQEMRRLSQAGLPGAAYMRGMGNEQTSVQSANFSQDLGTNQAVSSYLQDRFQKQQMDVMKKELELRDQQIRDLTAKADVNIGNRNWMLSGDPITGSSNQVGLLQLGKQLKVLNNWYTKNKAVNVQWDNELKRGLLDRGIPFREAEGRIQVLGGKVQLMNAQRMLMSSQMQKIARDIAMSFTRENKMFSEIGLNLQNHSIRQLQELYSNSASQYLMGSNGLIPKSKIIGLNLMNLLPFTGNGLGLK